ncbi:Pyrroline-5-carboxylate reductase [Maioricimonas rarisocia]|uniref:Pyrroline-5-carboxylate reductase n=1 Tax=Maioricimonas rarisocia TaxID=2528026 RepID=A0A517ZCT5_9PLAN|nr:pyrroline-5-carboxylate reductase [Maioricimonas rarisocia]QDU40298.1 Pyrroline-5-carboxylate reductase [Maioricimonas rarisocia]
MSDSLTIGFLGAGRMATALARGFVAAGLVTADQLSASDVIEDARRRFAEETGGTTCETNREVVERSGVVVVAVKPQYVGTVLAEVQDALGPEHLVISIAAGVTLESLANNAGGERRLVRVMPNTPALVQAGAAGFALGGAATAEDGELVARLLGSVGVAYQVPESLLDAVTGLSGSGPAYVFQIIEGLADGGVRAGLPRDVAQALAAQTLLGAARMVLETGEHPAVLKDAVASPGGTTIAGLHALERHGVRGALIDAVMDATCRARELGGS